MSTWEKEKGKKTREVLINQNKIEAKFANQILRMEHDIRINKPKKLVYTGTLVMNRALENFPPKKLQQ